MDQAEVGAEGDARGGGSDPAVGACLKVKLSAPIVYGQING